MSRRLTLTLALSIAAHALLGFLLVWLSLWPQRRVATLNESGGVVWFNLNPGGAGGGGAGGVGAPPAAELQTQATSAGAGTAPQARPVERKAQGPAPKTKPTQERLHIAPVPPEAPPPAQGGRPPQNAGWRGPGEGDTEGTKTGPGGGAGEGLGGGEGSGAGAGKGPGGVGAPGTGGSGQGGEASAVLAQIRQKISRAKRYPRQARAEGYEGVCGLSFEINPDGSLAYVHLTKSSGYYLLDDEALATVRRAAPFPYYAGPIRFSLRFSLKEEL